MKPTIGFNEVVMLCRAIRDCLDPVHHAEIDSIMERCRQDGVSPYTTAMTLIVRANMLIRK